MRTDYTLNFETDEEQAEQVTPRWSVGLKLYGKGKRTQKAWLDLCDLVWIEENERMKVPNFSRCFIQILFPSGDC